MTKDTFGAKDLFKRKLINKVLIYLVEDEKRVL